MELRKITQEELNEIIEDHQHWIKMDCEGWGKKKADLSCADLRYADLRGANLKHANLTYADLRDTNLAYVNLTYAILTRADLRRSDLIGANLNYTDLTYADLRGANLSCTDLSCANLTRSDLIGANLSCTDLSCANLTYADLRGANLSEVNYNHLTSFLSLQCPEEGSFIGYKKSGNKIVKLRIEEDSKRSSATSRKCRASKVTVLSITSIDGTEEFQKAENTGNYEFTYEVGKTYEIDDFDEDRWNECSTGIHFFITREEAVKY